MDRGVNMGRFGCGEYDQNILYEAQNYQRTNKNNVKKRP